MTDWNILLTKTAQKELSGFNKSDYKKIIKRVENLYLSPYLGKKLKGELSQFYSYRAWPYRIIYQINKDLEQIIITAVSHRQSSY